MGALLDWGGRALGILAGGLLCLVWMYLIWFPSEDLAVSGLSIVVAAFMGLLALVAAIAAFHGHSLVVFIVFVASFLPVGGYLLGVDHWLRSIGVLNILLLVSGLLLRAGKNSERTKP